MRKENNYKIFTSRYDLEYLNELIDLFQSMVLIKPIEEEKDGVALHAPLSILSRIGR